MNIIAALLPVFAQFAPSLISDAVALIKGNPQAQGEADDAYITRLSGMIDANAAKVIAEDAVIQADD